MRTEAEIAERVRAVGADDFFGYRQEVLLTHLSVEAVKPFLKPDADVSGWEQSPLERGAVLAETDGLRAEFEGADHAMYGCPALLILTSFLEASIEDFLEGGDVKAAMRMAEGSPCHDGCQSGCGGF